MYLDMKSAIPMYQYEIKMLQFVPKTSYLLFLDNCRFEKNVIAQFVI